MSPPEKTGNSLGCFPLVNIVFLCDSKLFGNAFINLSGVTCSKRCSYLSLLALCQRMHGRSRPPACQNVCFYKDHLRSLGLTAAETYALKSYGSGKVVLSNNYQLMIGKQTNDQPLVKFY